MTKDEFDYLYNTDRYVDCSEYARKMKLACFEDFGILLEGDGKRNLSDGIYEMGRYLPKYPKNHEDSFHRNISFIDFKYTIRNNKKTRVVVVTVKQLHNKMYPETFTLYDVIKTWYNEKLTTSLKTQCGKILINKNFLSKDIDEVNGKIKSFNQKIKNIKFINISDDVEMFIKRKQAYIHYIMTRSDILLPCIKMKMTETSAINFFGMRCKRCF